MKVLVVLESPFAGPTPEIIERNVRFARACLRDSCLRGEAPLASHLLYTQPGVLDDTILAERTMGIEAGLAWGAAASKTVVYTNLGISKGMQMGIERAEAEGRPVERRYLHGWRSWIVAPGQRYIIRHINPETRSGAEWGSDRGPFTIDRVEDAPLPVRPGCASASGYVCFSNGSRIERVYVESGEALESGAYFVRVA